jgi:hypothetical protein
MVPSILTSLRLSNLKRWCGGIGPAFGAIGVGNRTRGEGARGSRLELRALIRQMSTENQLWGAPRIHGELLKLGFSVAQSSVAKYMAKRVDLQVRGGRPFCENHAPSSGSTSRPTRRRSGSHGRSPKLFLGTVLRTANAGKGVLRKAFLLQRRGLYLGPGEMP